MTTPATESSSKLESTSHEGTNYETTNAEHSAATASTGEDKGESDKATDQEIDPDGVTGDESGAKSDSTGDTGTSPPEIGHVEKPELTKPELPPVPGMREKPTVGTAGESGKVTDLSSLSAEDIRKILNINNLFKGIKLRGEESPESTRYLVDPAKTTYNWSALHEATVVATTVFSERTARLIEQGWTKSAANFSSPWVSGGIEVSKNETHASQSTKRYLYTTSSYVLKKMKVTIDKEVAAKNLTKEFLDDVTNAVNEPVVEIRLERLREVFKKYGHVFLTSIVIGTSMVTSLKQEQTSTATVDTVETSMKAKVAAKWGAFSGGVSHGSGSTTESGSTGDVQGATLTFTTKGGNNAFSTDAGKWLESTGDHTLWTVITTEEVVPITDLLLLHDRKLGEQVNQCVPRPLIGRFIYEEPQFPPDSPDTRYWCVQRPGEEWLKKGWYWLGSSTDNTHLLVKEAEEGALGFIEKTESLKTWKSIQGAPPLSVDIDLEKLGVFTTLRIDKWIALAPVPANREEYVVLGHIHSMNSTSVPNGLRAVRKDLVVSAVPSGLTLPIVGRRDNPLDICWPVEPNALRHEEPALKGTSYFYYVKPEEGSETATRDMVLQRVPTYLLKESAILMTNTIGDAREEWNRAHSS